MSLYAVVALLYVGRLWDLEHAIGISVGLALGPVLLGRRPSLALPRFSRHEWRVVSSPSTSSARSCRSCSTSPRPTGRSARRPTTRTRSASSSARRSRSCSPTVYGEGRVGCGSSRAASRPSPSWPSRCSSSSRSWPPSSSTATVRSRPPSRSSSSACSSLCCSSPSSCSAVPPSRPGHAASGAPSWPPGPTTVTSRSACSRSTAGRPCRGWVPGPTTTGTSTGTRPARPWATSRSRSTGARPSPWGTPSRPTPRRAPWCCRGSSTSRRRTVSSCASSP